MSDSKVLIVSLALLMAVIMGGAYVAISLSEKAKSDEMQACVAAGKQWKHVRGSIYECVS